MIDVPSGIVDRGLSHPDVTSVVNDRFAAWFLHPRARPDLTARYGWPSLTALAPDGCVRMTTTTAQTPDEMIEALNSALVARAEGITAPTPPSRSWPASDASGGQWTLDNPAGAMRFTTRTDGAPAVVVRGAPYFFGGRHTGRAVAEAGSEIAQQFLADLPPGAPADPEALPAFSCSR